MGWIRFFRRRYWDDERARELEAYLHEEISDNIARGLSPDQARRAAHRKLGNAALIREDIYQMNTVTLLETAWQDLRYGARLLRRNPVFAAVAILTLALGTGANAAIFQLVDAVRLRSLPVERPDELAELRIDSRGKGRSGRFISRRPMLTYRQWQEIERQQEPFASLMAWSDTSFDLAGGGEERPANGLWVTGSFFDTLGVQPSVGRLIGPADDAPGCPQPGAVLSYAFWQREYGGDQRVPGRTVLLDGHRFDIIGVTPEHFFGVEVGRAFDVALPLCSEPVFRPADSSLEGQMTWFLGAIGRLKPGWTTDRATAQLRAISPGLFRSTLPDNYVAEDAAAYLAFQLEAVPAGTGTSVLRGNYSTPLWILLAATGLVLVIACANLANLLLARATAREREIGVRLAIGASRRRIARQLLSESLLLAAIGSAAGLLIAQWLSGFLVAFLNSDQRPVFLDLSVDWRLVGFTAAVAVVACLLFGLVPALRATAAAPAASVLGSRGTTDLRERFTLRRVLVVVQVALSLVLLVGALLFARSLRNLMTVDPGFQQEGAVVVSLDFRRADVPAEQRRTVYDQVVARLAGIPGVSAAGEAFIAPLSGSGWNNRIVVGGELKPLLVNLNSVGPGYFRALATPLVAGRDFSDQDTQQSTPVAIVNQTFVKQVFPNENPIGRVFHIEDSPGEPNPRLQIVGVVADTKYQNFRETDVPIAYVAARQDAKLPPYVQVVLKTTTGLPGVRGGITRAIAEINPAIGIQLQTMDRMARNLLRGERLMAWLSGLFGALAVLIATIGLYGVMSYMVARRRMEIGIRMALGADRASVVRMIIAEAGRLLVIGVILGAALSVAGARSAQSLLYGLQPWDPATLALGAGLLGAIALLASWLPAWRAARMPPTAALREEP
ncbi:MAG TPA: ABC transporter permease [Vicinamibacterales bacterium]|nr:ABC transporter permease [Vicinamibacterales bacterium]